MIPPHITQGQRPANQRWPSITALLLSICVTLTILFPANRAAATNAGVASSLGGDPAPPQQPNEARLLAVGMTIAHDIRGNEAHLFGVQMKAGQYARLSVRKRAVDLLVTVSSSDQRSVTSHENPAGLQSPINLTIIATTSGVYAVEVRPTHKWAAAGRYEIQLEDVRPPTPEDEKRHAATQKVAAGRRQQLLDTGESLDIAIVSYKNARELWKELGDRFEEANALHFLAETYWRRSALETQKELRTAYSQDASKTFVEAIEIRRADGDRQSEAYTRLGWAVLFPQEEKGGLPRHEKALVLFQESSNRRGQAAAFHEMGLAMANMQNWSAAIQYYQQALGIYGDTQDRDAYDRHAEARVLQAIGGAYGDWQKPDEAIGFYRRALEGWRDTGDIVQEGNTYNSLAVLEEGQGRFQTALDQYHMALDKYKQAEAFPGREGASIRRKKAVTLYNLADTYAAIFGDYAKAFELFDESLRHRDDPRGKGRTHLMIGQTHVLAGDPEKALESCRKALPLQEEANDPRKSQTYTVMGMAYAARGDHKNALDYFMRALEIQQNKQRPDPGGEAITQFRLGELYAALGDLDAALSAYAGARRIWREGGRNGEALALYGMARIEGKRNNLTAALGHVEEALKIIEPLRANLNSQQLRSSYFAAKVDYYGLYIDLNMRLRDRSNSAALTAAAFEASEHARSRGLLDILSEARVEVGMKSDLELAALTDKYRLVQLQIRERKVRRGQTLKEGKGSEDADPELSKLHAERDRAEAQIRSRYPRYAALMYPQPLATAEVQRLLDEDTLLVEFALGDERSYVWALTSTELAGHPLPPRSEIEATARRLIDLLRSGQPAPHDTASRRNARMKQDESEYWPQAAAFSRTLLGQVSPMLKKKKRLLIVADGQLLYFPFAALPSPDATVALGSTSTPVPRDAALVKEYDIVSLPSASVLSVLRQAGRRVPASKSVAVFADPIFERDDPRIQLANRQRPAPAASEGREAVRRAWRDVDDVGGRMTLPRLPASLAEARGIVSMVPAGSAFEAIGFKASRENATSEQLSQYRIVHFATHGILDEKNPELSGVVLSLYDEQGHFREDGFLRLKDIYNLRLPVDLVVLSACRTGLGKEVKGEGLIGLTRGFMYAGSPRVVTSLWKVDDDATAELMRGFYEKMLKNEMSPAAALGAAQAAMAKQKRWGHPYYWAGFILQGEPR